MDSRSPQSPRRRSGPSAGGGQARCDFDCDRFLRCSLSKRRWRAKATFRRRSSWCARGRAGARKRAASPVTANCARRTYQFLPRRADRARDLPAKAATCTCGVRPSILPKSIVRRPHTSRPCRSNAVTVRAAHGARSGAAREPSAPSRRHFAVLDLEGAATCEAALCRATRHAATAIAIRFLIAHDVWVRRRRVLFRVSTSRSRPTVATWPTTLRPWLTRALCLSDKCYFLPRVPSAPCLKTIRCRHAFRGYGWPQGMLATRLSSKRLRAGWVLSRPCCRRRNFYGSRRNDRDSLRMRPPRVQIIDRVADELEPRRVLVRLRREIVNFNHVSVVKKWPRYCPSSLAILVSNRPSLNQVGRAVPHL